MTRLLQIVYIAARQGLFWHLSKLPMPLQVRLALFCLPWWLIPARKQPFDIALRTTFEQLGPVPIKFGQLLSTRGDIIGQDLAATLSSLQDNVPPFSTDDAVSIIKRELGDKSDAIIQTLSTEPLASASIAQVHTAIVDDNEVVVKVVRPGIDLTIERDFGWLSRFANLFSRNTALGKRLRLNEVISDLHGVLKSELDLRLEAGNAAQLRSNFENSPLLYIPKVYWPYCSEQVMTSERIYGIGVDQAAKIDEAGFNRKTLAEHGVEIFFTQVFEHNFFHADMHPGNIMVDASDPSINRYIGLDCAIMGTLSKEDQFYMGHNLIAIFEQDYQRVADLHIQSGWVGKDTKAHEFAATMRSLCEPIFAKPLGEISLAEILLNLFATARRYDMRVQPSLVLLQKTLLHVEGLGRSLYPDLDLWNTALPFLKRWSKHQFGPIGVARTLAADIPRIAEQMPLLPDRLRRLYQVIDSLDQPRGSFVDRVGRTLTTIVLTTGAVYCLHLSSKADSATIATGGILLAVAALFSRLK